jgi:hypothetical protein
MRHRLIILFALLCVVGAGVWSVTNTHKAAKADSISTLLSGSAYGLTISQPAGTSNFPADPSGASAVLSNGPIGGVSTICSPDPVNQANTVLGINLLGGLITSTTIQDKLTFVRLPDRSTVVSTSAIEKLTIGPSLLAPLVEIDGLHAVSSSTAIIGRATSDTSQSSFGAIRIAGLQLPLHIAPNTRIVLPALGTIVLNEQVVRNIDPVDTYAEVNMVDITLNAGNVLAQPVGTHILIGHTVSIDTVVSSLAAMQAHSFGLYASLGVKKLAGVQVGPLPYAEISCAGGTHSASLLDLNVPPLVDGGVAQTRATGSIDGPGVAVSSEEKILNLSLLGGLIQAGLLEEDAHAIFDGTHGRSFGNFTVARLSIAGKPILPGSSRGLRIPLPGLGYVIVGEIVHTSLSIGYSFNALDIHITTPNSLKLAVGLRIIVGHVDAGITIFS